MFIKVILNEEDKKQVVEAYVSSNIITHAFKDLATGNYILRTTKDETFLVEEFEYNKLVGKKVGGK